MTDNATRLNAAATSRTPTTLQTESIAGRTIESLSASRESEQTRQSDKCSGSSRERHSTGRTRPETKFRPSSRHPDARHAYSLPCGNIGRGLRRRHRSPADGDHPDNTRGGRRAIYGPIVTMNYQQRRSPHAVPASARWLRSFAGTYIHIPTETDKRDRGRSMHSFTMSYIRYVESTNSVV